MRKCSVCKTHKDPSEFHRSQQTRDGYSYTCKACSKEYRERNRERLSTYHREWSEKNKEHRAEVARARSLRRRHGITVDEYDAMLAEQDGVCAICAKPPEEGKHLAVDHDHACCPPRSSCGKCRRGLLCTFCNNHLHWLENERWRTAAEAYLARAA